MQCAVGGGSHGRSVTNLSVADVADHNRRGTCPLATEWCNSGTDCTSNNGTDSNSNRGTDCTSNSGTESNSNSGTDCNTVKATVPRFVIATVN